MIDGSIPMDVPRRLLTVAALVTMAVQLTLAAAGTLIACANTPHTHNGLPAPDCPMHHAPDAAPSVPAGHEHHHQSGAQTDDGGRLTCGCSSDIPAFVVVGNALIPASTPVAQPASREVATMVATTTTLERFSPPLTQPPRLPLP